MDALSLHRVKPKQSLGQNFLIDDNIVKNIARDLHLKPDDAVVEIGPGHGALTKMLTGRTKHLLLVEIDSRIINALRETFNAPGIVILHQDFLEVDLIEWERRWKQKLRIVGNLPYHLTSPILFKIFDTASSVRDITIMVQREVAKRIIATPGTKDYGILSVVTQLYGTPKQLFTVSPNCFYPKPKVMSSVLHIKLHGTEQHHINADLFRTVVRTTFGKRRKTLRNSLQFLPFDEDVVRRAIQEIIFPLEKRPEELTLKQFIDLTRQLEHKLL